MPLLITTMSLNVALIIASLRPTIWRIVLWHCFFLSGIAYHDLPQLCPQQKNGAFGKTKNTAFTKEKWHARQESNLRPTA